VPRDRAFLRWSAEVSYKFTLAWAQSVDPAYVALFGPEEQQHISNVHSPDFAMSRVAKCYQNTVDALARLADVTGRQHRALPLVRREGCDA